MSARLRLLAHAWVQLALWLAICGVLNHLAQAHSWRLDITSDQRYSLSSTAREAVAHLDRPLTATVWFTEDLGPPYHNHRQALLDLLTELEASSNGRLDVVLREPTGDAQAVSAAKRAGIRPVTWAYRDWDQVQQRQVWMGVSFDFGDQHIAVDALPTIASMEHDVVRAILTVTTRHEDQRTVGWLQGNGEAEIGTWPSDHPLGQLREGLRSRHRLVTVTATEPIPEDIDALMVVGPQLGVPPQTRQHLDAYLMRGGSVAWFLAGWQPDFAQMRLREVRHDLHAQLGRYGIKLHRDLLLDRRQNEAMVVPTAGGLARVNYPLAPVTTAFDRTHAPVRDLTRAVLPFVSGLTIDPALPEELEAAVWLRTEPTSTSTRHLGSLQVEDVTRPSKDEQSGPHATVVALQGRFPTAFAEGGRDRSAPTRMVVAGWADMVANNPALVLNSVDWLLQDPRLVQIRSRQAGEPPLRTLDRPAAMRFKLAVGGSPLLILAVLGGLAAARTRRRQP